MSFRPGDSFITQSCEGCGASHSSYCAETGSYLCEECEDDFTSFDQDDDDGEDA